MLLTTRQAVLDHKEASDPTLVVLADVQKSLTDLAMRAEQNLQATDEFERNLNRYEANLDNLGGTLRTARELIRGLAHQRHDVEYVIRPSYILRKLDLSSVLDLGPAVPPELGDLLTMGRVEDVQIHTSPSAVSPCDVFGPDQLGISARVPITFRGKLLRPHLHFAIAISHTSDESRVFLSHRAQIRGVAYSEFPLIGVVEESVNAKLELSLQNVRIGLPTIPISGLGAPRSLCTEVSQQVSTYAQFGGSAAKNPLPRERIPSDYDAIIKIRMSTVIDYLRQATLAQLQSLPFISFDGRTSAPELDTVPDVQTWRGGSISVQYHFSLGVFDDVWLPTQVYFVAGEQLVLKMQSPRPRVRWEWKGIDSGFRLEWDPWQERYSHPLSFGDDVALCDYAVTREALYIMIRNTSQ